MAGTDKTHLASIGNREISGPMSLLEDIATPN
jgi:hypothetical protein